MTRYTLCYTTRGGPTVLFNLAKSAVDEIQRAQTNLGSKDFRAFPQELNYSQQECDILRPVFEKQQSNYSQDIGNGQDYGR